MSTLLFVGCKPDSEVAPWGRAPWDGPSEEGCIDAPAAHRVDGYMFCGESGALDKVPVDDPIYTPCAQVPVTANGPVMSVFDGVRARAFPIGLMHGREIVNDDWDGEPILVDY